MVINIKNKKDLITLDLRCKQIRYLEFGKRIEFVDLSNDDVRAYEYLYNENRTLFLKVLKEDLKNNLNIDIELNELEIE